MSDDHELAERLYGSADSIRRAYVPTLRASIDRLADREGLDEVAKMAHLDAWGQAFHDAGVDPSTGAGVHSWVAHYVARPADEATQQAWEEESRRNVRLQYGADGEQRMAKVREFVKARPALSDALHRSGAGSSWNVLGPLVERAHSLRVTPRKRK
jgi:hypothetical protein